MIYDIIKNTKSSPQLYVRPNYLTKKSNNKAFKILKIQSSNYMNSTN
ncbi:hypothetical protein J2X77_000702 [Sphingobacterium sp. 2149]|nr:hypothetical protein [Sphingobacterium sp. 2149]